MSESINGDRLAKWLASDIGKPALLVGYKLDDGAQEWLITGLQASAFLLAEVGLDGVTRTGQVKTLPFVRIGSELCVWSEADDQQVFDAIQAARSPLEAAAEEDFAFLLTEGWPGSRRLGLMATELAALVRRLGQPSLSIDEIGRIANIAEITKESSQAAARWIAKHLDLQSDLDLKTKVRAQTHLSALYRAGGRYDQAIVATDAAEHLTPHDVSPTSLGALLVTRAAAIMDRAESNYSNDQTTEWLSHAERLLKKAFAISGGHPSEYQNATYGRLKALQKGKA